LIYILSTGVGNFQSIKNILTKIGYLSKIVNKDDEMSLEDIYNIVNNNNDVKNYEHFSEDNKEKSEKESINYDGIDRKIKLKFNLNKLNKIELEDGKYIINEEFNT